MTREEIIGYNFRRLREKAGLSPQQAAEAAGVPVTNVYQLQGSKRSPRARISFGKDIQERWAAVFKCSVAEFFRDPTTVEPADVPQHRIPLISWVRAGTLHEPIDIYQAGFAEEWVASSSTGPNAFALRVVGNSMYPEFLEGDIIVIDPGIEPASGDYAIVKIEDEVTFKQIHFYLNKIVLVPINSEGHRTIEIARDDGFKVQIIGKVVEQIRRR